MFSVTKRARGVKQPYGGYIRVRDFEVTFLPIETELNVVETVSANLVGIAVDYMTRFMMGVPLLEAFCISLKGALIVEEGKNAKILLENIKGLDNQSIINACKLAGYDVCARAGVMAYEPVGAIYVDEDTIFNIRVMINRSLSFWEQYGPIIKEGFTFEGGYTSTVSSGDGDYMTKDTLWDFKVSKIAPKSIHTLQLLMYYIMGCRSIHEEFQSIKKLGIYNPRLNKVYLLDVSNIEPSVLDEVATKIIGY